MALQPVTALVLDGYDVSTNGFVTDYYCVWDTELVGIEAIVQGGTAPTGTFIIEASCEQFTPIQFSQIVEESQAISDNSLIIWNFGEVAWNWVRVTYNRVSGTGNVTLYITKKVDYDH